MTEESRKPHSADALAAAVVDDFEASGYEVSGYEEDEYDDDDFDDEYEEDEEDEEDDGDYDDDYDDYDDDELEEADLESDLEDKEDDEDEEDDLYDDEEDDEAEEAYLMARELPSTGVLSFYDRLRAAVLRSADRKGSRLGSGLARLLLVAPDLFILLARLALDRRVPPSSRALAGGALAYFLVPVDLLPEALVGVGGYADDAVLAAAVLSHVFSGDLEPHVRRLWSGSEDLRVVLRDVSRAGKSLLGESLYERLKAMLARRGVDVEAHESDRGEPVGLDLEDEAARAGA